MRFSFVACVHRSVQRVNFFYFTSFFLLTNWNSFGYGCRPKFGRWFETMAGVEFEPSAARNLLEHYDFYDYVMHFVHGNMISVHSVEEREDSACRRNRLISGDKLRSWNLCFRARIACFAFSVFYRRTYLKFGYIASGSANLISILIWNNRCVADLFMPCVKKGNNNS